MLITANKGMYEWRLAWVALDSGHEIPDSLISCPKNRCVWLKVCYNMRVLLYKLERSLLWTL